MLDAGTSMLDAQHMRKGQKVIEYRESNIEYRVSTVTGNQHLCLIRQDIEDKGLTYSSLDSTGELLGDGRFFLREGFLFFLGGSILGSGLGSGLGADLGSDLGSGIGSGPKPKKAPGKWDDFGFLLGLRRSRRLSSVPRVLCRVALFGWGFLLGASGLERSTTNQSSPGQTTGIL
jgi:hypothetical protein